MPSSRRPTRSPAATPITACSSAWAVLCSFGPPRQTASHVRPPDSTSRLAHWWASITGWRWTNVAMQPTPRRTREVTAASAERSVTDSRRGFASRLAPTQTASNAPERSPSVARPRRSGTLSAPSTTARFARIRPNESATGLPPCVPRGPLLEEGGHALTVVVGRAEPRVRLALELERGVERRVGAAVQHELQRAERERGTLGELGRQRLHGLVELVVGDRLRDQPPGLRLLRRDPATRHHEQLGAGHAHQSQGPLSAAAAGDHPEPDLRKRELRAPRRDAEIAGHRQLEAGPHREPVDRGDHRLPAALGRGERVAPHLEVRRRQGEEFGHVATGAERLPAGAADDDHPHGIVGLECREDPRELVAHRHRHRVHLGLTVDPQGRHGARRPHSQELAHEPTSVYRPSRSSRRRIFPEAVLGISRTNTKRRGRLKLARAPPPRQCRSSAAAENPGARGTTKARTRSPHFSSGSPITATSATSGCCARTSSTSIGWMFSPPLMIMSSARPATHRRPSAST